MLRRLHSRIIGLGSVCGLPPSPPAEVFLKSLPPPGEVDAVKYLRFQEEEKKGPRTAPAPLATNPSNRPHRRAPEPFNEVVAGASGHKHVALLTREGHLITFGENRYGQTAAPKKEEEEENGSAPTGRMTAPSFTLTSASLSSASSRQAHSENPDWAPLYIDLGDAFGGSGSGSSDRDYQTLGPPPALVTCGSNFTIVYQPGGRRAIAFGNNHVGQLGVGHKNRIDAGRGFEEWNPAASWWPRQRESVLSSIVSGYNHSIAHLSCGTLYAFGTNTWGELSVGTTISPMQPERITFFEERGKKVKKVAAGNSFTLFLTEEGRVYGCGATNFGQLPANSFEPVPVPLVRSFVEGAAPAPSSSSSSSSQKLIRIKDIACVGNMSVYVSTGDEILVQGSLPEYGVATYAPRLTLIDQTSAVSTLKQRMADLGWPEGDMEAAGGFTICGLVAGPSTLLVRFRNGCVGALGANSEGQLHNVTKNINGRAVNLAPSFSSASLLPVFAPSAAFREESFETLSSRAHFLAGSGFTLLLDNDEVYPVKEYVKPIELPPGRSAERRATPPTASPSAANRAPREGSGMSRRERLRSSLR